MYFRTTIASAALWLALASGATASSIGDQVQGDAHLIDGAVRSVNSYARFTIFDDVNVQADGGVVTLTGRVTMPFKKEEIGKRIGALDGVRSVRNEIQILPVSIFDDELRQRVARAIYGNSAFWRYAAMANPPIHIVVENGRVTLTGVVFSEVDRVLARSLATGLGELSVTNCLRTDAAR